MDPKEHILIIAPRLPHPSQKGDQLRLFHQIKSLSEVYDIDLWYFGKRRNDTHLQDFCKHIEAIPTFRIEQMVFLFLSLFTKVPFQTALYQKIGMSKWKKKVSKQNYVLIYAQLVRVYPFVKKLQFSPLVFDLMDALSAGLYRRIKTAPRMYKKIYQEEVKRLSKYERNVLKNIPAASIISLKDKQYINASNDKVHVIKNGVDYEFFKNKINKTPKYDLVFVGNMGYQPNHDAARFIIDKIAAHLPEYQFLIAGRNPHESLLKKQSKNVHISGELEDIRSAYWDAKLFIAPMLGGAGMQNKILEANACGLPVLTTSLGSEPIFGQSKNQLLHLNEAAAYIRSIRDIFTRPDELEKIHQEQTQLLGSTYSWEYQNNKLIELLKNNAKTF